MFDCFSHCRVVRVKCQLGIDGEPPDKHYVMPFSSHSKMHEWLNKHPQYYVKQLLIVYSYDE